MRGISVLLLRRIRRIRMELPRQLLHLFQPNAMVVVLTIRYVPASGRAPTRNATPGAPKTTPAMVTVTASTPCASQAHSTVEDMLAYSI